jgi:hypothetical protein
MTRQGKHDGMGQRHAKIFKLTSRDVQDIRLAAEYGQINAKTLKTACKTLIRGINSDK